MRRVIVSNIVSLDGFHEGPDQGVMDLPMGGAFDTYNLERFRAADTALLGARSYEGFVSYWPSVADHPEVPDGDPTAPMYDATNRAISRRWNEIDVAVVSDTVEVAANAPWAERTHVVRRDGVREWLAEGDGDCIVFGSRTMWTGLLAQGLVDELHLMVGPVAFGGGTRVFDQRVDLRLLDVRRFDDSDNIVLVYAPEGRP